MADWNNLASYRPPDPLVQEERGDGIKDWEKIKKDVLKRKKEGLLIGVGGECLFDRLYFLNQIKEVVNAMADPKGGFMMEASIYGGDVPLKNIEVICEAMEEYCFLEIKLQR